MNAALSCLLNFSARNITDSVPELDGDVSGLSEFVYRARSVKKFMGKNLERECLFFITNKIKGRALDSIYGKNITTINEYLPFE